MIASLVHDWFGVNGSVLTNLVASAICFALGYAAALRHVACHQKGCHRIGTVPVSGTVHKACKKHAAEQGHAHL